MLSFVRPKKSLIHTNPAACIRTFQLDSVTFLHLQHTHTPTHICTHIARTHTHTLLPLPPRPTDPPVTLAWPVPLDLPARRVPTASVVGRVPREGRESPARTEHPAGKEPRAPMPLPTARLDLMDLRAPRALPETRAFLAPLDPWYVCVCL